MSESVQSNVKNCAICRNLFIVYEKDAKHCADCMQTLKPPTPVEGEKLLSQINAARTATVFGEWINPIFAQEEKALMESMKANFKNGSYTELVLASHVAQLVAIDSLRERIRSVIAKGDSATKALEKGGSDGTN